jgi:SAM-dependent methyltransferase
MTSPLAFGSPLWSSRGSPQSASCSMRSPLAFGSPLWSSSGPARRSTIRCLLHGDALSPHGIHETLSRRSRSRVFEEVQRTYWSTASFRPPDDAVVAAYADPKLAFLQRQVPLAERSVLDVGCGNGIFTSRLARVARRVIGVDLSFHMLASNPHRSSLRGSATDLPFADRSFDVVFEANLLHHVDDPGAVLAELCRCSARHVLLIEPNRWNPVMFGFGVVVKAERGTLRSSRRLLHRLVERAGWRVEASTVTGMISQNNTPGFLVPWLKWFDRAIPFGEYVVLCATRP